VRALLARSEAWHLSIDAAGGTVARRILYRASSVQVLGSVINGQLGVAARIAALRRSSSEVSPQAPTLVAAEFPILAVEATLGAFTSFTLVGRLGLPWWLPAIGIAVIATASAGLRELALRKGRELWRDLAVLRSLRGAHDRDRDGRRTVLRGLGGADRLWSASAAALQRARDRHPRSRSARRWHSGEPD
jgi:hypothetical protein